MASAPASNGARCVERSTPSIASAATALPNSATQRGVGSISTNIRKSTVTSTVSVTAGALTLRAKAPPIDAM